MNHVGIKDVASLSGVSESTVSKVLKNYPNISEKTREKVMQVVKETGYMPNAVASNLSSKAKNRIALYVYINDKFQQIAYHYLPRRNRKSESGRIRNLFPVTLS